MLTDRLLKRAAEIVRQAPATTTLGRVGRVTGLLVEASLPGARIGDLIEIDRDGGGVLGEIVGFRDKVALCIPFGGTRGVAPGARVHSRGDAARIGVSQAMMGRVVDPFGHPLDGGEPVVPEAWVRVEDSAPDVRRRTRIKDRFETGVRAIDGLLTCGRGQRIGIFAGAGAGKTVLIRQIARQAQADVTVVALIGERGVEVQDLLETHALANSVVVVATSDRSPMERTRGALAATAVAEHFRDQGKNVLLIVDSLTRYAMGLREIGLAAGEPTATKGYPPSVFAAMPRLLERAAPVIGGGSITAFYTVLVEGDDLSDPVADSARSLLDAHIVLSRDQAGRGNFPAVDVLASTSRVFAQVTAPAAQEQAQRARSLLATRREAEELRSLGAYIPGHNPAYDQAVALGKKLDEWMRQRPDERTGYEETMARLAKVQA